MIAEQWEKKKTTSQPTKNNEQIRTNKQKTPQNNLEVC